MDRELKVELLEPSGDLEDLEELTRNLRLELLELDVDAVSPVVAGPAPPGSKGLEVAVIGALLVRVAGSVDTVGKVVNALRSWLRRGSSPKRSLKISLDGHTLELTSATEAQQQQLVEEFIRALATPA